MNPRVRATTTVRPATTVPSSKQVAIAASRVTSERPQSSQAKSDWPELEALWPLTFRNAKPRFVQSYLQAQKSTINPTGIGRLFLLSHRSAIRSFRVEYTEIYTAHSQDPKNQFPPEFKSFRKLSLADATAAFERLYFRNIHWSLRGDAEEMMAKWADLELQVWKSKNKRARVFPQKVLSDPLPGLRRSSEYPAWYRDWSLQASPLNFEQALQRFQKEWERRHGIAVVDPMALPPSSDPSAIAALQSFERIYVLWQLQNGALLSQERIAAHMGIGYPEFFRIRQRLKISAQNLQDYNFQAVPADLRILFSLPYRAAMIEFRRHYFQVRFRDSQGDVDRMAQSTGLSPQLIRLALERFSIDADSTKVAAEIPREEALEVEYEFSDLFQMPWENALPAFQRLYCRDKLSAIDPKGLGEVFLHDWSEALKKFRRIHQVFRLGQSLSGNDLITAARRWEIPRGEIAQRQRQLRRYDAIGLQNSSLGRVLALAPEDAEQAFKEIYFRILWEGLGRQTLAMVFWTGIAYTPTLKAIARYRLGVKAPQIHILELLRDEAPKPALPREFSELTWCQAIEVFGTRFHELTGASPSALEP